MSIWGVPKAEVPFCGHQNKDYAMVWSINISPPPPPPLFSGTIVKNEYAPFLILNPKHYLHAS